MDRKAGAHVTENQKFDLEKYIVGRFRMGDKGGQKERPVSNNGCEKLTYVL